MFVMPDGLVFIGVLQKTRYMTRYMTVSERYRNLLIA